MSKYGVILGPYFPAFELNTGKCGPEIIPYLNTFHAVLIDSDILETAESCPIESCSRKAEMKNNFSKKEGFSLQPWIFMCYYVQHKKELQSGTFAYITCLVQN